MRVLIASAFATGTWDFLKAQSWFIAQTTEQYTHVVACPVQPPGHTGPWLPVNPPSGLRDGQRHIVGLRKIAEWFQGQSYDLGVICDSDAFPVRRGWVDDMLGWLRTGEKAFCAPIRTENLDLFPHVSFLAFTQRSSRHVFPCLRYGHGRRVTLHPQGDVGAGLPLKRCFPLLKSNVWSPSATWHTIYSDVVYHRGSGSRVQHMRGNKYWEQVAPARVGREHERVTLDAAWINKLLGEERFTNAPQ